MTLWPTGTSDLTASCGEVLCFLCFLCFFSVARLPLVLIEPYALSLEPLIASKLQEASPRQVAHAGGRGKRIHRGRPPTLPIVAAMLRFSIRIEATSCFRWSLLACPPAHIALVSELQSYIKGASRDLRNEVTSWAGSALSSFNTALQQRTGKSLQDYGVDPDAIGKTTTCRSCVIYLLHVTTVAYERVVVCSIRTCG
jgi:hypothetical protein